MGELTHLASPSSRIGDRLIAGETGGRRRPTATPGWVIGGTGNLETCSPASLLRLTLGGRDQQPEPLGEDERPQSV